jgi:hypothetical protein
VFCIFNFIKADAKLIISLPSGVWKKALDSCDKMWNGPRPLLPEEINSRG